MEDVVLPEPAAPDAARRAAPPAPVARWLTPMDTIVHIELNRNCLGDPRAFLKSPLAPTAQADEGR
jgi:hypothetical protein